MRQEAERRLASLESDLARKESSEKERKNAERYHKVRFFERQKLVRQIKKLKKEMAEQPEKKRKKLEAELREKRVLLNYVLVSLESDATCQKGSTKDEQNTLRNLVSLTIPWRERVTIQLISEIHMEEDRRLLLLAWAIADAATSPLCAES